MNVVARCRVVSRINATFEMPLIPSLLPLLLPPCRYDLLLNQFLLVFAWFVFAVAALVNKKPSGHHN